MKKFKKHQLWYAADVSVPKGEGESIIKEFSTWFGMMWFCMRDPQAYAAVQAGRVRFIHVVKDRK